jgi:hypothetical protein
MPRTIQEMLRWSESIWFRNSTYAAAMRRVVSYFITKIEIHEASDDKKNKYENYFNDTLNVKQTLIDAGLDYMCYGNAFVSLYVPFNRFLECTCSDAKNKICGYQVPIKQVKNWQIVNKKIKWTCPKCQQTCECDKPIDKRFADEYKVKLKLWNPHEMQIMYNPISERSVYVWEPPADLVSRIKNGDKFLIEDMPWEMVEAVLDNKLFEFSEDVIFHMKCRSVSGIRANGWGLSYILNNFNQAYYIQMAKLYNEVLMQEFIVPFRVVSPDGSGSGASNDPLIKTNVGSFNKKVLAMFEQHRRRPGGYYALPFPIKYQAISGEGAEFTTYEHINMAMDELLNASNVPAELYKGTMAFQSMPTALRLFQQTWMPYTDNCHKLLDWLTQNISLVLHWDKVKARLQPITLADDLEKRQLYMQLLASNKISAETALAPLGVDAKEEFRRFLDEQREQMELQQKFQEEMEQKQMLQDMFAPQQQQGSAGPQQGGGGQQQGDPSQQAQSAQQSPSATALANVSAGATPEDLMEQAKSLSEQLVRMPYELRRGELANLKKSNETLWSLVKAQMEQVRSSARTQGAQQVLQQ